MILQKNVMSFDIFIALPMFLLWIGLCAIAFFLITKKKLTKRSSIILYIVSLIIGGILLGGIPNAVMPIQTIFSVLGTSNAIQTIMAMIIILVLLLLSVVLFGRVFCGFACPLGAMQELASKVKFKSSIKEQKAVKYKIDISYKAAMIIRWGFFVILVIFTIIFSFALLQLINPFSGFQFFKTPTIQIILIPLIFLGIVLITSFFVYRPWCRLFCPFGALASLTGRVIRGKYERTDACTECGLCEKICPTHQAERNSTKEECYYCNRCVEICPVNAIEFKFKHLKE
ncbi:MAG: 4Fe-4S binding protein [Promethearchaeota archaeon]